MDHKNPVPLIPKGSLPEPVKEENQEELADPDSPGKVLKTELCSSYRQLAGLSNSQ